MMEWNKLKKNIDLGVKERKINESRKYVIGWCYGHNLICRPKSNEIALMCFKDENDFWFHLREQEVIEVFSNGTK